MRKRYILAGMAVLLLALGAGWYVLSPWWTVREMIEAAKAGKADALAARVDFPALRADLKTDLDSRLSAEARKDRSPQAQFGIALARSMMDKVVDAFISPGALAATFKTLDENAPPRSKTASSAKEIARPQIERIGLDRFRLEREGHAGSGFVFERHGLGWKLVGVDLPADPSPSRPR